MAIDKSLDALLGGGEMDVGLDMGLEELLMSEEEMMPDSLVTELGDGGVEIDFDPMADMRATAVKFESNLAEHIDDDELRTIALDLVSKFQADKSSR